MGAITWEDRAQFPDLGISGTVDATPRQQPDYPATSYSPVITDQQTVTPWEYGDTAPPYRINVWTDQRDQDFSNRDHNAGMTVPMFGSFDQGTKINYEIGGEAGKVNQIPYTMGAVVPFENFEMTGRTVRLRRKPEGNYGPVKGQQDFGVDHGDLYYAGLIQSADTVPSDIEISVDLANPITYYDGGYPG